MRRTFKHSKAFSAACLMPPGKRHQPEDQFDWAKSEVYQWLISQPEIQSYIFSKFNYSGAIVYNQENGSWSGRDFFNP